MAKKDEQASWAMEAMELKIKLKELENSEKEARRALMDSKKETQVFKAELQSVERTAKTISLVKEQG